MPKASAPSAPWVEVWLSPQTMQHARQAQALLGADHMDDALARVVEAEEADAGAGACRRCSACAMARFSGSAIARELAAVPVGT